MLGPNEGIARSAALDEERRFVSKGTLFEVASLLARGRERLRLPLPGARLALVQRLALAQQPLIGTGQPVELVDEAAHVSDLTGLPHGVALDRLKQLIGSDLDGVRDQVAHRDRVADRDALEPGERLRDLPRDAQPDHRQFELLLLREAHRYTRR